MEIFKTSGVCAKEIQFELENNIIKKINFIGGCPGNLIGIKNLIEGMDAEVAIERLSGVTCGMKDTSCPDQLAIALRKYLNNK